ncbi:uncharacterized protein LOC135462709 [Liolophura sinensis]|uniref:uncharacterized protein LOC135462709 n=1 Tax=Liolophura sinensis TaxID=3198878 RepID=UPI003158DB48
MLGLIATVCYLRSEKTNDQDKVTSKMSNEGENVAAIGMDGGSEREGETEEGAVGGTPRPELQGHYASIWFDPEVAGTSGIRRSEEPTVYAQIDFNASTRLIKKGKGKGKKSRV